MITADSVNVRLSFAASFAHIGECVFRHWDWLDDAFAVAPDKLRRLDLALCRYHATVNQNRTGVLIPPRKAPLANETLELLISIHHVLWLLGVNER